MAGPQSSSDADWIAGFEVIPYALPFAHPYVTARGILEQREMVLLRVQTSDGLVGLGEAVPLSLRGGASLDAVVAELSQLRDEYQQASGPRRYELLLAAFEDFSAPSRCALYTAWFDFSGKAQDMPAWQLLGGYEATPLACNATLTADEPFAVAEQATAWAADGFETFKLKVGVQHDVDQVARVRNAVGPGAKLRVDANGAWSTEEAISNLSRMAEHEIELAEQPCASLEEMAAVRAKSSIRIAGDESIESPEDAEAAISAGACDLATIKLSKVGGPMLSRGVAVAISSYMSSALDGPVGIAAAAHAAQALYPMAPDERYDEDYEGGRDPGLAHGLATQRLFAETIASRECELRDGFLHLPEGPGLGVEIDDAALERHRL
jgi:L-alanine-DL-glutamate epimerase-like enolase superfamily enzyme